jgi:hypothetical protein
MNSKRTSLALCGASRTWGPLTQVGAKAQSLCSEWRLYS